MFKFVLQLQSLRKRFFFFRRDEVTSFIFKTKGGLFTDISKASRENANFKKDVQPEGKSGIHRTWSKQFNAPAQQPFCCPQATKSQIAEVPGCRSPVFGKGANEIAAGGEGGAGAILGRLAALTPRSPTVQPLFRPGKAWLHNERRPWERCVGRGAVRRRDTPEETAAKAAQAAKAQPRPEAVPCVHTPSDPCDPGPDLFMDPTCKAAVVTGGAAGIGLAAGQQLLAEGAGHVLLVDRKEKQKAAEAAVRRLNRRYGAHKAHFAVADVALPADLECVFDDAVQRFGHVNILVNNAAVFEERQWQWAIDNNVKAVLHGCHLAMQHMSVEKGGAGGLVVNVSAVAAWDMLPSAPIFCATKRAVLAITESFGHPSLAEASEVRVLSLCPGYTATPHMRAGPACHLRNEWATETQRRLRQGPSAQPAAAAGRALLYVLRYGRSATHYIVQDSCVSEVRTHSRSDCARHIATLV